jgi:predicted oxidoreductase
LPGRFDLSFDHIVEGVDGSLKRLQTGYLDILLLHRPDPLVEPEEVAQAFDLLHRTGKVRKFGVSNHSPAQIEYCRLHGIALQALLKALDRAADFIRS